MRASLKGVELIKHFEGCRLDAYLCPASVWTIGYGHTGKVDGKTIQAGMKIPQNKATELLREDMAEFEKHVLHLIDVPLTQNQFDALVSFSFNVGAGALKNSTLRKLLNQGKYKEVPAQLGRWNKAKGKVLAGLTRRRKAEGVLWSTGQVKFT